MTKSLAGTLTERGREVGVHVDVLATVYAHPGRCPPWSPLLVHRPVLGQRTVSALRGGLRHPRPRKCVSSDGRFECAFLVCPIYVYILSLACCADSLDSCTHVLVFQEVRFLPHDAQHPDPHPPAPRSSGSARAQHPHAAARPAPPSPHPARSTPAGTVVGGLHLSGPYSVKYTLGRGRLAKGIPLISSHFSALGL